MINYDPHDWRSHLLDIHGSMIREITGRVLTCVLWTLGVVFLHEYLLTRGGSLAIPELGHSLIGVALGLLLVFRTNASYDRFWEGRRQWGSMVNESRNLIRAASVYLAATPDLIRPLALWTSAFAWSTMNRLRGQTGIGPIAGRLPAEDVRRVLDEQHTPLAVSRQMTALVAEGRHRGAISDIVQVTIDQNTQLLIDAMGACERIHNTRLPFAYVVHLRRALILYCFTLPFALLERFGWGTIAAVLLISYVLYGIEEIGVEIEDPFGEDDNDLPLAAICTTIEGNLISVADAFERSMRSGDAPASAASAGAAPSSTIS